MRKIIILLVLLLAGTGLLLIFVLSGERTAGNRQLVSLAHIWGGLFFLVLFPLYAWDHVSGNRRWLKKPALVTFSGGGQLLAALVLILSGVVLLLYGVEVWPQVRLLHHLLTYALLVVLGLHFLSPK